MNVSPVRHAEHVLKRNTLFARWMPAILYAINIVGALATAIAVGATELLYLVVFALPAVILYMWRTRQRSSPDA